MNTQTIFLCGHRKSGTTLLLNLLDGHPELAVYPSDVNYLYGYFPIYVGAGFTAEQRRARFERVVFAEIEAWLAQKDLASLLDVGRMREAFFSGVDGRLDDIGAITQAFANAYRLARGEETRPFVAKETSIEIYAAEFLQKLPQAKFVQLVRDPRDNFAALKAGVASYYAQLGEDESVTLASLIHRARLGLQYAVVNQSLFPENVLILKFEDLVSQPDATLERLCAFLGISNTPSLRVPTELGRSTRGNNFDGFDFSALSTRNVERWRQRITDTEAQVIEFHFAELMETFGYAQAFGKAEQATAAAAFYKWQNYKYFFSDRFQRPLQP